MAQERMAALGRANPDGTMKSKVGQRSRLRRWVVGRNSRKNDPYQCLISTYLFITQFIIQLMPKIKITRTVTRIRK